MREYSSSILIGAICPILDVSFEEAVLRSPLSTTAKAKADLSLSAYDFIDLWDTIIELAGSRFDPFALGKFMANGPLIPIFLAYTCAPNLRIGLERLGRYKVIFGPVSLVVSTVSGRKTRVEVLPEFNDLTLPVSMAIPMSIFVVEKARNHSARHINPALISLPKSVYDMSDAADYFGSQPLLSNIVSLEFTSKDANTRFISQNETLWKDVERELEQQLEKQAAPLTFTAQVEAAIRTELYSGPTHVIAICNRLQISRSTLQRRLKDEGYTFQVILDSIRFDLAARYLTKSNFSIGEVSRMIGYQDPKSFFRAFKREFKQTPEEYRSFNMKNVDLFPQD